MLPNELGTSIQTTSGPALSKPADLLPFLTNLEEGSVLFIDEIHRMPRVVEEFIYPAMEDFRIDIVLGEGMNARTISMQLKRFTLIGATTRSGMLSGPMRDRFKMHEHLEFYSVEELATIVRINSAKLNTPITDGAARKWRTAAGARRESRTPVSTGRAAIPRRSTRATSREEIARAALDMAEVDREGLDKNDRRYLEVLIDTVPWRPDRRRSPGRDLEPGHGHARGRDRAVPAARTVHLAFAPRPRRHAARLPDPRQDPALAQARQQGAESVRMRAQFR